MSNLWPSSPGDVVTRRKTFLRTTALGVVALAPLYCSGQKEPDEGVQARARHVLWIIPNFATSPGLQEYKPLASSEKFRIAAGDTFDRGTIALAAAFAGESQFSRSNPSFGGGAEAYAHYWITAYSHFAVLARQGTKGRRAVTGSRRLIVMAVRWS